MTRIIDKLEPEVLDMAQELDNYAAKGGKLDAVSSIAPMVTSVAISLKRLADTLEILEHRDGRREI